MVLRIVSSGECGLHEMCLTPKEFSDKAYHPFIATTEFDKVIVELSSDIPAGYLSQLVTSKNKVIPIINELNQATVYRLCEILPDKAAKIRYTYMRDRSNLEALINELAETYNWKEESK